MPARCAVARRAGILERFRFVDGLEVAAGAVEEAGDAASEEHCGGDHDDRDDTDEDAVLSHGLTLLTTQTHQQGADSGVKANEHIFTSPLQLSALDDM
jgi:hypothetical protein